jgi:hypothetical protein
VPKPEDDNRQPANFTVLVVVVVIVVASVWLLVEFKKSSAELDCFMAGRKNCVPVDASEGSTRP